MRTIGTSLKLHRKLRGLSQQDIGDILGVTYQQIQKYETNINGLSVNSLLLILDAWNISFETFMGIEEKLNTNGFDVDELKFWLSLNSKRKALLMSLNAAIDKTLRELE